ncbi:MAG: malate synthase G, partial [Acidimicrobiaceae bacterium]|nr:malate synthase G [Acidimicrobiaceae bacterium]
MGSTSRSRGADHCRKLTGALQPSSGGRLPSLSRQRGRRRLENVTRLGDTRVRTGSLEIAPPLHEFIAVEALPGTGVQIDEFWSALESILTDLGPRNAALLAHRDELQTQIDDWHRAARADGRGHDGDAYANFLRDIGYLRYMDSAVTATTTNVDPEIAEVAGPQLVVPVDNARYALNAANARWGSLYDALYGTDVLSEADGCSRGDAYNPVRGDRVVAAGREFLDTHFGLDSASHAWATDYLVQDGSLRVRSGDGTVSALLRPEQFVGYTGAADAPASILLRKNGLHCELRIDADHPVGRRDHAGIFDIRLESALTAIMDFEDSVSAVDADDKVAVYRNWLGLMRGTLETTFVRDGRTVNRSLHGDRSFIGPDGSRITLPGRSLMLVRNVGHHLTTDMVTLDGEPVYETMVDAMVTALCALHDLRGMGRVDGRPTRNSASGSVYIVKPKLHGPDEVALACDLLSRVETALGLVQRT